MAGLPKPGWTAVTIGVIALTTLGAATPVARGLYEVAYPGPGSNVVTPGESLERALTKAQLTTSFNTKTLIQDVPAIFTATIVYGAKPPSGAPTIRVAYANDATLAPLQKDQFEITPQTDSRQNLDEGHLRPAGGYELDWRWQVTPRASGSLSLRLEIQPVLVVIGSNRTDLETRNKPIAVTVKVNPAAAALDEVKRSAQNLEIGHPTDMVVGEEADWTATLDLKGHADVVKAQVNLIQAAGSAPTTISLSESRLTGDRLVSRWAVTPTDRGPVKLAFAVDLSARAGDKTIRDATEVPLAVIAHVEPSFWERVQAPVLWLTPLVALLGGVLGLRAALRTRRRGDQ